MPATRRFAAILLVLVAVLVGAAVPASAHTNLVASTPAPGAQLDALDAVELSFDGAVDPSALHVWLESDSGILPLSAGAPVDAGATRFRIALPPVGDGAYALGWHLLAADGDPSAGGVPFTIGAASPADAIASASPPAPATAAASPPTIPKSPPRTVLTAFVVSALALVVLFTLAHLRMRPIKERFSR